MGRRRYSRELPIYEALFQELRRRGFTQQDAATEIGISKQVMHNWLTGRHVPSETHCPAVAEFLGVEPVDVEAMISRARRVDRITELERVQAELVRAVNALSETVAELKASRNHGAAPLPRARRVVKP
jgi:transcriptional regulator with XRE-family HTH domain